jgi:hypothetical protein
MQVVRLAPLHRKNLEAHDLLLDYPACTDRENSLEGSLLPWYLKLTRNHSCTTLTNIGGGCNYFDERLVISSPTATAM